ncbi:type 4 pilus major pilin [Burkholderia ambifaria]|uniref:type 4 pilus major pilin n=1 Tax=Burkholderia ambifaria TaxID=152480 RepID=UPI00158EB3DD|nr:type 4 pilus major pilin [Burkholderia ambifaria]
MREFFGSLYGQIITVFSLIAIITLGGNIFSTDKGVSQATDVGVLVTNARQQLGASPNGYAGFTDANVADLIRAGVIPATMVRNGALVDRWKGAINISNQSNGGQGVITLNGINIASDCAKLVTTLGNGYDSVIVGGTTFNKDNPSDGQRAGAACNGQTTVTVVFS